MALLSDSMDAAGVIHERSHRRIRLREILLVLPLRNSGKKG